MHVLVVRARDTIIRLARDHEEQLAVEKRRSNFTKAQITDLTGLVMKKEELLSTFRGKERMALAEVKTPDV